MKTAEQDTINTPIGIRVSSYLRQEEEKDSLDIWAANRSFLEEDTLKGTRMGPRSSKPMTNESIQIEEHEIQYSLSDFHAKAAEQLATDSSWEIPDGIRTINDITQSPHP
eukprot:13992355-Heterocapsa_arctica.AAC.1